MANNDLEICNQALNELGEDPIQSFTAGSDTAQTCGERYPDFRKFCLTVFPWKFVLIDRYLVRIAGFDPIGFKYAHQLPADRLDAPEVLFTDVGGSVLRHFRIVGDRVYSDFENLWCRYSASIPENHWPPVFTQFVIIAFAGAIGMAVTEKNSLVERLQKKAWGPVPDQMNGGLYMAARRVEGRRGATRSLIEDGGALLRARRSGGGFTFAGPLS